MAILQKSDFASGPYSLSQDSFSDLDTYIEKYEPVYLLKLLGSALYTLFNADLSLTTPQVAQTAPYTNIFNAFNYDDGNCIVKSDGIKEMLKQFIYFHYLQDQSYQKTKSGVVRNQSENANNLGYNGYNLIEAYNDGVKNTMNIQLYIYDNNDLYPDFNGEQFFYTSGI